VVSKQGRTGGHKKPYSKRFVSSDPSAGGGPRKRIAAAPFPEIVYFSLRRMGMAGSAMRRPGIAPAMRGRTMI
tara:strand:+ start:1035 stop:1253 length:219 start_codon:yes stop_codon:yes gene_type:complete